MKDKLKEAISIIDGLSYHFADYWEPGYITDRASKFLDENLNSEFTSSPDDKPTTKQDEEAMNDEWVKIWREFGRRIDRVDYFQKGWKAKGRESEPPKNIPTELKSAMKAWTKSKRNDVFAFAFEAGQRKSDDRLKEAEGLIARVRDRINNHAGYFPPYFRSELLAFLEQEEK